jgi:hypothetical protein
LILKCPFTCEHVHMHACAHTHTHTHTHIYVQLDLIHSAVQISME